MADDGNNVNETATTKKKTLFEEEDEDAVENSDNNDDSHNNFEDEKVNIRINKEYARSYERRKAQQELKQVRFDGDAGSGGSSSEEEEDENAELLTSKVDVDIFRTIHALRTKNPIIYNKDTQFFPSDDKDSAEEEEDPDDTDDTDSNDGKRSRKKKMTYKDVVREEILAKMDNDDDNNNDSSTNNNEEDDHGANYVDPHPTMHRLAYDDQQQQVRQAFLEASSGQKSKDDDDANDDESSSDGGGFMVRKRRKTHNDDDDEKTQQERELLLKELERMKETTTASGNGNNQNLVDPRGEVKDGEGFLLDYFRKRPWIEKDDDDSSESEEEKDINNIDDDDRKPRARDRPLNYNDSINSNDDDNDDDNDDASLQDLEEADDFEAQYNFRFEQAAAEAASSSGFVHSNISYARNNESSLRRKDETRSAKRKARKERKTLERKAKEEQLKRLKNAKRQELQGKLEQIRAVLGEDTEGFDEATVMKLLEGDFDPARFEEIMQQAYNDDFYQKEDAEWKDDRAVRESLKRDEDGALLVGQDGADGGLYDNDQEVVDEGDEEADDEEEWLDDLEEEMGDGESHHEETEMEKKVKKKIEDELYKYDYEDIVDGMPTRFKYRQVDPNNYGLRTEEILFARDSTLKQFVSLKRMAPYQEKEFHINSKKRRRFREMLKKDLEEEYGEQHGEQEKVVDDSVQDGVEDGEKKKKKRRRLKKSSKKKLEEDTKGKEQKLDKYEERETDPASMQKKRRRKNRAGDSGGTDMADNSTQLVKDGEPSNSTVDDKKDVQLPAAREAKVAKKAKKHKKKKRKKVEGVSDARLASYGL